MNTETDIQRAITQAAVNQRFMEIMRRHLQPDDIHLSDDDMIRAVMWRYEKTRGLPLIDPDE